jgi:hypothetical protein
MNYSKTFNLIAITSKGEFPVTVNLIDNGGAGTKREKKWAVECSINIHGKDYKCSSFGAYAIQSETAGKPFGINKLVKIKLKGRGFRDMDRYRNESDRAYADSFHTQSTQKENNKPYSFNWWASGMNGE